MSIKSKVTNTVRALTAVVALATAQGCYGDIHWGTPEPCYRTEIRRLNYEGQFVPLTVIHSEQTESKPCDDLQNKLKMLENEVQQMKEDKQKNDRINWYVVDK